MKYDMAGARRAGAMRAIAQLRPPIAVTALVPAVENMPGSRAQRPGDIVTTLSGKTVEVLNTDAEGRLILADALPTPARSAAPIWWMWPRSPAHCGGAGARELGVFASDDACFRECFRPPARKARRCGPCRLTRSTKSCSRAPSRTCRTSPGWAAPSRAAFLKEFADPAPWRTWISPGPPGWTTPRLPGQRPHRSGRAHPGPAGGQLGE